MNTHINHEMQSPQHNRLLIFWLLGSCFLIWLMIMLGGATRLTHAGLSIVEWKPVVGIIPPFTQMDWMIEFEKYKQFPEYKIVNYGMSLDEFKFIFFMEYAHRLLGRLIGLFFFIPLIVFWMRGCFDRVTKKRMTMVMILGMAQGGMGWYMVRSGLVKDPSVSAYRLTVHLLLALVLLGLLFWTALSQMNSQMIKRRKTSRLVAMKWVHFSAAAIVLTITYGGFVAGLKAGKIYNTYPLMGGQFLPSEWNFMSPLAKNFVENPAMVQWVHRTLAILTLGLVVTAMLRLIQGPFGDRVKRAALLMIGLIMTQVMLGIMTLLYEVPVSLGTLHQGMGVIVLMMILQVMFLMGRETVTEEEGDPQI